MKTQKQRKTLRMYADYQRPEDARSFKVLFENDEFVELDGGDILGIYSYRKLEDGRLTNQYGNVKFTVMKADRRPKPYAVRCFHATEDYSTTVRKFATLAEAAQYCFERYQGVEYFDGKAGFHTDYCQYSLVGFALADIYDIDYPNYTATRKELR